MFNRYSFVGSFVLILLLFLSISDECAGQFFAEETSTLVRLKQDIKTYNDAVRKQDSAQIAEASYKISKRHIHLANYGMAEIWLLKALAIREKFNHYDDIGKIYLRRHEISLLLERTDEAMRNARLAMKYFRKANSHKGIMSAHAALGAANLLAWEKENQNQGQSRRKSLLDLATRHFEESLKLSQLLSFHGDEAIAYRYLGICAMHRNQLLTSFDLKIKAWEINKEQGLLPNAVELAVDIANQYLDYGHLETGKLWLERAKKLLGNRELSPGSKMTVFQVQAKYYEQTGRWKEAIAYRHSFEEIKDKVYRQYRNEALEGVRKSEEAKLKEVTLTAQRKELALLRNNAALKNQVLYITGLLLIISAVAGLLYSQLYKKYRRLSQYNEGLVKEQNHRTKNDLQVVSTLLSLQSHQLRDPNVAKLLEESLLRVESIILIHRRLYQGAMPMFVDMKPYLADLVQSILKVYHKIHVELILDITPLALHVKKMAPLALIVNELMTNACKYGLDSEFPKLSMSCHLESGLIIFLFTDNGPGFKREIVKSGFGLGLIDMLCQQLDGSCTFRQENGCQFLISFSITEDLVALPVSRQTIHAFL